KANNSITIAATIRSIRLTFRGVRTALLPLPYRRSPLWHQQSTVAINSSCTLDKLRYIPSVRGYPIGELCHHAMEHLCSSTYSRNSGGAHYKLICGVTLVHRFRAECPYRSELRVALAVSKGAFRLMWVGAAFKSLLSDRILGATGPRLPDGAQDYDAGAV